MTACQAIKYPYELSYTSISQRAGTYLLSDHINEVVQRQYTAHGPERSHG